MSCAGCSGIAAGWVGLCTGHVTIDCHMKAYPYLPTISFHNQFKDRRELAFPFLFSLKEKPAEPELLTTRTSEDASKSIRSGLVNAWHGFSFLAFHSALWWACIRVHAQCRRLSPPTKDPGAQCNYTAMRSTRIASFRHLFPCSINECPPGSGLCIH